jgi:hypothetical protein
MDVRSSGERRIDWPEGSMHQIRKMKVRLLAVSEAGGCGGPGSPIECTVAAPEEMNCNDFARQREPAVAFVVQARLVLEGSACTSR